MELNSVEPSVYAYQPVVGKEVGFLQKFVDFFLEVAFQNPS